MRCKVKAKKTKKEGVINISKFEFTYQNYLQYLYLQPNIEDTLYVAEDSADYFLEESKNKDKKHDKIFRDILQDKAEMTEFIRNFVQLNIKDELEQYKENYITKEYKYKQADVVYKVKGKEIYYLVEHQTKVDYSMPYRILNYCIEIIRHAVKNKEINKISYKYPVVIPIVLYTGNKKWTANTTFSTSQIENIEKTIDVEYKLVDINEYEISELLSKKTMLTNAMILEKCNNNEEVIECLKMIINNKENLEEIKRLIIYLYEDIKKEKLYEIFKLIEESEGEEKMSTIAERLKEEYINERKIGISLGISKGISQGISQTISEIIKRMLKMNLTEEFIKEVTGANKEKIEKIKKEIKLEKQ